MAPSTSIRAAAPGRSEGGEDSDHRRADEEQRDPPERDRQHADADLGQGPLQGDADDQAAGDTAHPPSTAIIMDSARIMRRDCARVSHGPQEADLRARLDTDMAIVLTTPRIAMRSTSASRP